MKCKICDTENPVSFSGRILSKYDINYYHCSNCDFLQTEQPYWLDEAYSRPINVSDTGYMVRNLFFTKRLSILLYLLFGKAGRYLDYAAGYGVFVRMMRDNGFDFYWDDKYTKNLFAVGFQGDQTLRFHAITLFEVFEHFVEPMFEIEKLLDISDTIIFSTDLRPNPVPQPKDWWYYGLEHGQHISFYSSRSFKYIATQLQLNYCNVGSLHVLSRREISTWKLNASKGSAFGLHKIIERMMTSKTWSDHEFVKKVDK